MSKIKKVLAVFLTLAMVMGMGLTTFAAGKDSTITVTNADEAVIKYVQIVAPDTTSTIGWKFTDSKYAEAFKTAYNVNSVEAALKALIADTNGESPNANAEAGDTHSSKELGTALASISENATNEVTGNSFPVSSAGLYLITASKVNFSYIPMLAYVNDNGSGDLADATVTAKGSSIIINKNIEDVGQSVSKGDKVGYSANVAYPYFSADAADKSFKITDTLTNATFENDYNLEVYVGSNKLDREVDYTASVDQNKTTLEINFISDKYVSSYANQTVTITYTATVGDVSDAGLLQNKIESSIGDQSSQAIVISGTVKFEVTKTGEEKLPLQNAEFTLYVEANKDAEDAVELKEENGNVVYGIKVNSVFTDENGKGIFNGLDAQKVYYVKETKAPDGYSLNDNAYKLKGAELVSSTSSTETINKVSTTTTTYIYNDFDPDTIEDTKLSSLPSTGGIGTTIFTIGGCLIMIIAAALFFASRRKNNK